MFGIRDASSRLVLWSGEAIRAAILSVYVANWIARRARNLKNPFQTAAMHDEGFQRLSQLATQGGPQARWKKR